MLTPHPYILSGFGIGLLIWILFIALVFLVHFVPSFLAFSRHHSSRVTILILNILFGWTGVGWIILFFWALS